MLLLFPLLFALVLLLVLLLKDAPFDEVGKGVSLPERLEKSVLTKVGAILGAMVTTEESPSDVYSILISSEKRWKSS